MRFVNFISSAVKTKSVVVITDGFSSLGRRLHIYFRSGHAVPNELLLGTKTASEIQMLLFSLLCFPTSAHRLCVWHIQAPFLSPLEVEPTKKQSWAWQEGFRGGFPMSLRRCLYPSVLCFLAILWLMNINIPSRKKAGSQLMAFGGPLRKAACSMIS